MVGVSTYTKELGEHICNGILQGRTLKSITGDSNMPRLNTIMTWLHQFEEFNTMYYKARQLQMELIIDGILEISDDASNDYTHYVDEKTGEVTHIFNHEHVARSRLKIDTRKFLAAKLAPRIYGERVTIDHQGGVKASLVIMDSSSGQITIDHETQDMKVITDAKSGIR